MMVDGEKRHYTAIKNISRLLSKLNGKTERAYHFFMNCRDSTAVAVVTSRSRCPLKKKNG